ncbi:MAG: metal/formaldehyde-sensitive transcriptional repressor [Bdellovibrio sp.]|nr:metal/formaldehyde-sensitive transcriptional repressor [Bdellovibrio sp.]
MSHTLKNKVKITSRVNRIIGQLEAFKKGIEAGDECYQNVNLLSSCRGAINGLLLEVIEDHIREHIVDSETKKLAAESGEELIDVLKSFIK